MLTSWQGAPFATVITTALTDIGGVLACVGGANEPSANIKKMMCAMTIDIRCETFLMMNQFIPEPPAITSLIAALLAPNALALFDEHVEYVMYPSDSARWMTKK
ncbi:MAG TPA: hypothetical protein VIR04_01750 [Paralcaligenes sp.]